IWIAVQQHPQALIDRVVKFVPSVEQFQEYQNYLAGVTALPDDDEEIVEIGFRRVVISYLNYRGLSGGPRGSYSQDGPMRIDDRWRAARLCQKVDFDHRRLTRVDARVTCDDFQTLVDDTSCRALLYLDPPY